MVGEQWLCILVHIWSVVMVQQQRGVLVMLHPWIALHHPRYALLDSVTGICTLLQ